MFDKSLLHRMQLAGLAQAFDGRDLVALVHDGEAEAAIHAAAVDVDRAGAALAVVAALLGAGELKAIAQGVEERGPRVQSTQHVLLAIDAQRHVAGTAAFRLVLANWLNVGAADANGVAPAKTLVAPRPEKKDRRLNPRLPADSDSVSGSRSTDC